MKSNPNLNCIYVMISHTSNSVVNHSKSQQLVSKENSISMSNNNNHVINASKVVQYFLNLINFFKLQ